MCPRDKTVLFYFQQIETTARQTMAVVSRDVATDEVKREHATAVEDTKLAHMTTRSALVRVNFPY